MITNFATEIGFECVGETDTAALDVKEEVRDMCAADKCHSYGRNWTCPPACGTLEHFAESIRSYAHCVVVQTVMELEDEFDVETMMEAAQVHQERMARLKTTLPSDPETLVLGAGACMICPSCSCPDEPCRFPDKAIVSMEAAGLLVSDVCTAAGVPYNHDKDHISYTGCVLS